MNILVTGSEGRIGKHVVQTLLKAGHHLRTFDIHARRSSPDIDHIPGDLRNLGVVRRVVQGVEAVVHLGAYPGDFADEELAFTSNVQGTWNMLQAAQEVGVTRFVFFSSINAISRMGEHPELTLPADDFLPHFPRRTYGLSKHLGEEMCKAYASDTMKIISLRPTLVAQMNPPNPRQDFYKRWRERKDPQDISDLHKGDLWSYVDVDDVSQAALLSLTAPVDPYYAFLLTADDTVIDVPTGELVREHYPNTSWPRESMEAYLADNPYRSLIDCGHAKQVLGWQPKFSWRTSA